MPLTSIAGIVPAPLLPLAADHSVDWEGLKRYMKWIVAQKPSAIAMNMDSSEVVALRRDEQIEVIRVCKAAIGGACPLLSGLVAGSTDEAVGFAMKLKHVGAEGLVIFPPLPTFLGKPLPTEMVYRYHKQIADATELPIVGFQLPKGVGPEMGADVLAALAAIPQFIGLKDASYDAVMTVDFVEAAAALPRKIGILTGSDSFILEAMLMGCDGALIGFAGTAVAEQVEMHAAAAARDYDRAMAIWMRLRALAKFVFRAPNRDYRARMKELLVMQGQFARADVRLPLLPIEADERAELKRLAGVAGLLAR